MKNLLFVVFLIFYGVKCNNTKGQAIGKDVECRFNNENNKVYWGCICTIGTKSVDLEGPNNYCTECSNVKGEKDAEPSGSKSVAGKKCDHKQSRSLIKKQDQTVLDFNEESEKLIL